MNYKIGDSISLDEAMEFALFIAQKGEGLVEPNPSVGSVLYDEVKNQLISFGHHQKYGEAHAEVNCLKNVESAEGLTLIVTLEPCSHYGKTPPCADLVISKKPKKLIYMSKDPNPLVSGRGLKKVQDAGVEVEQASTSFGFKNEMINHKFFYAFKSKKSYVHLKWAESADQKTAVLEGSPWITNLESREHSHYLRAQSQAVLVGRKTLELDDPSLNIRKKGYEKPNKVLIFDPYLKTLNKVQTKSVYKTRPPKDLVFLCEEPAKGLEYSFVKLFKNSQGSWDLDQLTKDTKEQLGIQSIFVEGGAETLKEFVKQKIYNRISVYRAPVNLENSGSSPVVDVFNDCTQLNDPILETNLTFSKDQFKDLLFER